MKRLFTSIKWQAVILLVLCLPLLALNTPEDSHINQINQMTWLDDDKNIEIVSFCMSK